MLRHNVENNSNEHDEIELSRRSFFGRLAVGAVLSIAMPGVVHAAKSSAVKADKNNRLAQTTKGAVRLPKHNAIQAAKAAPQSSKMLVSHVGKPQKTFVGKLAPVPSKIQSAKLGQPNRLSKTVAMTGHNKSAHVEHAHLQSAHAHNTRVRDVYGKKQVIHTASGHSRPNQTIVSRVQSIIQPPRRESVVEPEHDSIFLADRGRFATHRALAFQNPHTGDKLSLTYFEKGRYLSDALDEISFLLRDYRTGDVYPIDPELLDQLHDLKQMLGLNQAFDVVCGYRSPLTNARLHAEHSGVANNSFHMHGRAVDIRIERFDLRRIRNAALAMHRGGVGYYPESNFIHLDTGTFRTWSL